jgi:hypothetical protein
VDEGLDLGDGNADENDGLVMLDQLSPDDRAVEGKTDDDVDRLSGISCRVDGIAVEINIAQQAIAGERGDSGRLALDRTDPGRLRKDLARLSLLQKLGQPRLRRGGQHSREEHRAGNDDRPQAQSGMSAERLPFLCGNDGNGVANTLHDISLVVPDGRHV